ncbi:MAG TPA: GlsB/YeaQ/YmgE family stress response membrane protein [Rubricoccaceae bacterium]|nr:GlsB/YeaQ/YmgE family stress response membrane protein [Rubricoccaceae bacterium]
MINLILFLIVGGLVGWIASKIMGTDAQQGVLLNVVIGIVGALLGGWLLGSVLGFYEDSIFNEPFDIGAILIALVGALLVIWIWKMIAGRRT